MRQPIPLSVTLVCTAGGDLGVVATPAGGGVRPVPVLSYRCPSHPVGGVVVRSLDVGYGSPCRSSLPAQDVSLVDVVSRDIAASASELTADGHAEAVVVAPPGYVPLDLIPGLAGCPALSVVSSVALVDATTAFEDLDGCDSFAGRGLAVPRLGRTVPAALVDQVERADVVALAATDEIDVCDMLQLDTLVRRLNPAARAVTVVGRATPASDVLAAAGPDGGAGYDEIGSHRHAGWLRMLCARTADDLPASEVGITATVLTARRPLHPQRLHDCMDGLVDGVVRSRGWLWLASRPDQRMAWDHAGRGLTLAPDGYWPAVDAAPADHSAACPDWDPYYGYRGQELALIGLHADPAALTRVFRSCLLTDVELALGEDSWRELPDPFPAWLPDLNG